jgi:glycosyltransferase involved in cell wall biosynthesis
LFPNKERFHRKAPNTNGSSAPFRIITVADHSDVKDPSTLLRTIKLLATRGRDICLEWIGRELQPNYASELVASLGLKDRVRIRGHIPHRRIPEHLKSADLYLQSSRFESQGVAVCEAAACGLPLVGTAVGILRELAPGGAIVVEPGNPVALADAVERVICDTALRERLGGGAVEWMSNYSLDWTVENVLQLYNSLLLRPK